VLLKKKFVNICYLLSGTQAAFCYVVHSAHSNFNYSHQLVQLPPDRTACNNNRWYDCIQCCNN